jgi:hypothetical protein
MAAAVAVVGGVVVVVVVAKGVDGVLYALAATVVPALEAMGRLRNPNSSCSRRMRVTCLGLIFDIAYDHTAYMDRLRNASIHTCRCM